MKDSYYDRDEVSNSDLSALKKYFYPDILDIDPTNAYRFGNLIDAMLTEPAKLDYYKRTVDDYEQPFTVEQWEQATAMKKAFRKDPFCFQLLMLAEFQKVFAKDVNLNYGNLPFSLRMRCKFDLWMPSLKWGGDIKSTAATNQRQFEDACYHFSYNRQRAVYMTLSGAEKDVIIGISKVNFKIFKITITRNDEFFKSGMEEFTDLAFKYWSLFHEFNLKTAC